PRSPSRSGRPADSSSPAGAFPSKASSPRLRRWNPRPPPPENESQPLMPGLLRGVARTAVVAGTATAVSNRVSRRQANRWAAQEAPPQQQYAEPQYAEPQYAQPAPQYAPPPAPAAPPPDRVAQLKILADLKAQGVLTDGE